MIVRNSVFIIATAFLASCAKVVVVPLSDNSTADGMFYALPKTVLRVSVKVDHTVRKAAPFMKYASIFAPDGQPVCKDPKCAGLHEKDSYELQQGASFTTYGEPDPNNIYVVKFQGDWVIDQAISMTWNDSGLLSGASASVTNRSTDIAISGLKMAASLGTKAFFGATRNVQFKGKSIETCPDIVPGDSDHLIENDQWIIPILKEKSDALVINYCDIDKNERDQFTLNDDKVSLKLAANAFADHVMSLATSRQNIISGNSQTLQPSDLLTRLDSLIDQYLAEFFLGSKKTTTWEGSLDVRNLEPSKGMSLPISLPILRIDPDKGICVTDQVKLAPDAKPYPEKFKLLSGAECLNAADVISMTLSYFPAADSQMFEKIQSQVVEPSDERSFRYRIPAQVLADVSDTNQKYGSGVLSIAQLGYVASLPATTYSHTLSSDLTFIEATGGLKSFKLGSTGGLDSATVDALSGVGGTILDSLNSANKDQKTARDEVTTLTRQQTLLKLKDEICDIQKKYGLQCTVQP